MKVYIKVMSEINCSISITVGRKCTKHFTERVGSHSGKFQIGIRECRSWNLYRDTTYPD